MTYVNFCEIVIRYSQKGLGALNFVSRLDFGSYHRKADEYFNKGRAELMLWLASSYFILKRPQTAKYQARVAHSKKLKERMAEVSKLYEAHLRELGIMSKKRTNSIAAGSNLLSNKISRSQGVNGRASPRQQAFNR